MPKKPGSMALNVRDGVHYNTMKLTQTLQYMAPMVISSTSFLITHPTSVPTNGVEVLILAKLGMQMLRLLIDMKGAKRVLEPILIS